MTIHKKERIGLLRPRADGDVCATVNDSSDNTEVNRHDARANKNATEKTIVVGCIECGAT